MFTVHVTHVIFTQFSHPVFVFTDRRLHGGSPSPDRSPNLRRLAVPGPDSRHGRQLPRKYQWTLRKYQWKYQAIPKRFMIRSDSKSHITAIF